MSILSHNVEYQVVIFAESALGSILLGSSKVDPIKFAEFLNIHAKEGWKVVTMEKEIRRSFLFFTVEAMVVVMEKQA
ncbi:TPA: DUF4177 domain-containing protein [Candidatus Gracilibacteria bacterium]|nr:DUF4177 domain-containing protein [Candidatus Peregrinibacteria bacterium]HIQ56928.1 DUF4177 domain-containing protein [Candidatus Gracilibacteria bacterium]HIQ57596.1 DUF4177 domain-containing protein [Candidatus Gracilibacteria bacterium]